MLCQRIAIVALLVLLLGYGFGWFIVNWQWWAVFVPSIVVISIAESIEQEIRGWH